MPIASLDGPCDERVFILVEICENSVFILKVAVTAIGLDSNGCPSESELLPARDRAYKSQASMYTYLVRGATFVRSFAL